MIGDSLPTCVAGNDGIADAAEELFCCFSWWIGSGVAGGEEVEKILENGGVGQALAGGRRVVAGFAQESNRFAGAEWVVGVLMEEVGCGIEVQVRVCHCGRYVAGKISLSSCLRFDFSR